MGGGFNQKRKQRRKSLHKYISSLSSLLFSLSLFLLSSRKWSFTENERHEFNTSSCTQRSGSLHLPLPPSITFSSDEFSLSLSYLSDSQERMIKWREEKFIPSEGRKVVKLDRQTLITLFTHYIWSSLTILLSSFFLFIINRYDKLLDNPMNIVYLTWNLNHVASNQNKSIKYR